MKKTIIDDYSTFKSNMAKFINELKTIVEVDEDLIFIPPIMVTNSENVHACVAFVNLVSDEENDAEEQLMPPLVDLTNGQSQTYPKENILTNFNSKTVKPSSERKTQYLELFSDVVLKENSKSEQTQLTQNDFCSKKETSKDTQAGSANIQSDDTQNKNSDQIPIETTTENLQKSHSEVLSPSKDTESTTSTNASKHMELIQQEITISILPSLGDEYDQDGNLISVLPETNSVVPVSNLPKSFDSKCPTPVAASTIDLTEQEPIISNETFENTNSVSIEKNINLKFVDMSLLDEMNTSRIVNAEIIDVQNIPTDPIDLNKVVYIKSISNASIINWNPGSFVSVQLTDPDSSECPTVSETNPLLSQAQHNYLAEDPELNVPIETENCNWETSEIILTETENELLQEDLQNDLCWETIISEIQDDSMPMFVNEAEEARIIHEQYLKSIENDPFPIVLVEKYNQLGLKSNKQNQIVQSNRRRSRVKQTKKSGRPRKKVLVDKSTEIDVEFDHTNSKKKHKRSKKTHTKDIVEDEHDLPRIKLKINVPRKDLSRCIDNPENLETDTNSNDIVHIPIAVYSQPQKQFTDPFEGIQIHKNGLNLSKEYIDDMNAIDLRTTTENESLATAITTKHQENVSLTSSKGIAMTAKMKSVSLDTGICGCSVSNTSGSNGENSPLNSVVNMLSNSMQRSLSNSLPNPITNQLKHSLSNPLPTPISNQLTNSLLNPMPNRLPSLQSNLSATFSKPRSSRITNSVMLSNPLPNPQPNPPCIASTSRNTNFAESRPVEYQLKRKPCAVFAAAQSPALSNYVQSCCSTMTRKRRASANDTDMDDAISIFAPSLGSMSAFGSCHNLTATVSKAPTWNRNMDQNTNAEPELLPNQIKVVISTNPAQVSNFKIPKFTRSVNATKTSADTAQDTVNNNFNVTQLKTHNNPFDDPIRNDRRHLSSLFKRPCYRYLLGRCTFQPCSYNHCLPEPESIRTKLLSWPIDLINRAYTAIVLRFIPAFFKYFPLFCDVYGIKGDLNILKKMICDCEMPERQAYHFLRNIYRALLSCHLSKCEAVVIILTNHSNRTVNSIDILVELIIDASPLYFLKSLETISLIPNYRFSIDTINHLCRFAMTANSQQFDIFLRRIICSLSSNYLAQIDANIFKRIF